VARHIFQAFPVCICTQSNITNTENIIQVHAGWKMNEQIIIDSDDGFIGVQRKRKRVKKFFLSGIAENVKDQDILSLLKGFPLVGRWFYRHKMSVSTTPRKKICACTKL
jgi:hypothetical protein